MCTEKLQLEVGKTYVNGEGCPVILVYKGWGSRPFLGVVDASTDNERTAWYKEDGESTYGGKMSLVREKRPLDASTDNERTAWYKEVADPRSGGVIMCNTKYKVGDRVVCAAFNRQATVLFVDPNRGEYPLLVLIDPLNPGGVHGSAWSSEDELRPAPVKVTSEKYRRFMFRNLRGETNIGLAVSQAVVNRWETSENFIGWVDKDWITSEIEVTPK